MLSSLTGLLTDYDIGPVLGKGGFATVYKATHRSNLTVAIKIINKTQMKMSQMVEKVKNEASIHPQLKNPSILECYNCCEDDENVYLILEYCKLGDLRNYMEKRKTLSEPEAKHILQQVLDGIVYLHKNDILHRDLTLANLLMKDEMQVKIADFGLATRLKSKPIMKTMCGTPNYIAPEVALGAQQDPGVDLWGLGVLLYTLLFGFEPFKTKSTSSTLKKVITSEIKFPWDISPAAQDILLKLLEKDPYLRITAEEAKCHPFFAEAPGSFIRDFKIDSGVGMSCRETSSQCCDWSKDERSATPAHAVSTSRALSRQSKCSSNNLVESSWSRSMHRSRQMNDPNSFHSGKQSVTLCDKKPPKLSTLRLPARSLKVADAVYKVGPSGQAILERYASGRVVSCCKVSRDGMEVIDETYLPPVKDKPPDAPIVLRTNYDNMPPKLWRKYRKLGEFTRNLQSTTIKITLVSDVAMCNLMERSPDCFMAQFFSGTVMKKNGDNVTVSMPGDCEVSCSFDRLEDCTEIETSLAKHFKLEYLQCLELEKWFSTFPASDALYPAIFGSQRRKVSQERKSLLTRAQSTPISSGRRPSRQRNGLLDCELVDGRKLMFDKQKAIVCEESGDKSEYQPNTAPPDVLERVRELSLQAEYRAASSPKFYDQMQYDAGER